MKNFASLHQEAMTKIESLENEFNKLFDEIKNKYGDSCSNEIWEKNYQSRYDALDKILDAASRVLWYTNPNICRHNKQINHRATIIPMRNKGLHKMEI